MPGDCDLASRLSTSFSVIAEPLTVTTTPGVGAAAEPVPGAGAGVRAGAGTGAGGVAGLGACARAEALTHMRSAKVRSLIGLVVS